MSQLPTSPALFRPRVSEPAARALVADFARHPGPKHAIICQATPDSPVLAAAVDALAQDDSLTIGLNLNHKFGSGFSLDFDAATSNSESGGDGPDGNNSIRMNVAAAGAGWQGAYYGGGSATATVGVLDNVANALGASRKRAAADPCSCLKVGLESSACLK